MTATAFPDKSCCNVHCSDLGRVFYSPDLKKKQKSLQIFGDKSPRVEPPSVRKVNRCIKFRAAAAKSAAAALWRPLINHKDDLGRRDLNPNKRCEKKKSALCLKLSFSFLRIIKIFKSNSFAEKKKEKEYKNAIYLAY